MCSVRLACIGSCCLHALPTVLICLMQERPGPMDIDLDADTQKLDTNHLRLLPVIDGGAGGLSTIAGTPLDDLADLGF